MKTTVTSARDPWDDSLEPGQRMQTFYASNNDLCGRLKAESATEQEYTRRVRFEFSKWLATEWDITDEVSNAWQNKYRAELDEVIHAYYVHSPSESRMKTTAETVAARDPKQIQADINELEQRIKRITEKRPSGATSRDVENIQSRINTLKQELKKAKTAQAKIEAPREFKLDLVIQRGATAEKAVRHALGGVDKWLDQRITDSLTINGNGAHGTAKFDGAQSTSSVVADMDDHENGQLLIRVKDAEYEVAALAKSVGQANDFISKDPDVSVVAKTVDPILGQVIVLVHDKEEVHSSKRAFSDFEEFEREVNNSYPGAKLEPDYDNRMIYKVDGKQVALWDPENENGEITGAAGGKQMFDSNGPQALDASIEQAVAVNPALDAVCALLWSFISGEHYKTQNPYTRPEVAQGLKVLRKAVGQPDDNSFDSKYLDDWKKRNGKAGGGERPEPNGDPHAQQVNEPQASVVVSGDRNATLPKVVGIAVKNWLLGHGDMADNSLLTVLLDQGVITPEEKEGAYVERGAREHKLAHVFLADGSIVEIHTDGTVDFMPVDAETAASPMDDEELLHKLKKAYTDLQPLLPEGGSDTINKIFSDMYRTTEKGGPNGLQEVWNKYSGEHPDAWDLLVSTIFDEFDIDEKTGTSDDFFRKIGATLE